MTHETPPQPEPRHDPLETVYAILDTMVRRQTLTGAERARSIVDDLIAERQDAARLPVSGESEGLRKAAQAALDEWDVATKDWLEWFARGGKGFHTFPREARNRLAAALTRSSEARTEELRTATAWLIERGQNRKQTPPIYWRSRGELPSDADEWTADPWQAARFSTRAAAQEAIHSLTVRLEAVGDPVEHGFLTRSSEARTDGPESVSPGGDVPQSDGPVVDEPAATDSDPLERARVLIETIAAASAELATLYGPLWHLTRSSEARTEPEAGK